MDSPRARWRLVESTIDDNSATHVGSGDAFAAGGTIALTVASSSLVDGTVSGNSVTASGPGTTTALGGGSTRSWPPRP